MLVVFSYLPQKLLLAIWLSYEPFKENEIIASQQKTIAITWQQDSILSDRHADISAVSAWIETGLARNES